MMGNVLAWVIIGVFIVFIVGPLFLLTVPGCTYRGAVTGTAVILLGVAIVSALILA